MYLQLCRSRAHFYAAPGCQPHLFFKYLFVSMFKKLCYGVEYFFVDFISLTKLCFETKSTKLGIGHFTSISSQFFANYINRFHKTEVLTVILKDPTCQNLNWIKSYNINHNSFYFLLFSIL